MTPLQRDQIAALKRCTFSVGSFDKRFVKNVGSYPDDRELSEKGAATLNRLAHTYRKQIGRCLAAPCEKCATPAPAPEATVQIGANLSLFGGGR